LRHGGHHLVEHDIRSDPHDGQITPTLPDDLMSGCYGDEMDEAFHHNRVTVMH
jgi:hypothetical protein